MFISSFISSIVVLLYLARYTPTLIYISICIFEFNSLAFEGMMINNIWKEKSTCMKEPLFQVPELPLI